MRVWVGTEVAAGRLRRAGRRASMCSLSLLERGSESRQALRAVVGNGRAGDLFERAVRLDGVADQFRGICVGLVEVGRICRQPAIARTTAEDSCEPPYTPS